MHVVKVSPVERLVFAVSAAQGLVERTRALLDNARMLSGEARAARRRSAALRLLARLQRSRLTG